MLKILDLFSGTQSVRKALDEMNIEYEYYGIDIYSPEEENIILDLSQNDIVNKLVDKLPPNWKPDFIWCSIICNQFSRACQAKGGNVYFEVVDGKLVKRKTMTKDMGCHPQYHNYHLRDDYTKKQDLALKLIINAHKIIDHYNVDFVIENPYNSLIEYVLPKYIKNKVDYCRYGFTYQKSTAIYSNKQLELMKCNHNKHKDNLTTTSMSYSERAKVPPELISDILSQFGYGNYFRERQTNLFEFI